MKIGDIGVTLDDIPGLWVIWRIRDQIELRLLDDIKTSKTIEIDNFWVLL